MAVNDESGDTFYFHAVIYAPDDTERDAYAKGEDWTMREAFEHFEADLLDDEEIALIEEVGEDEYPKEYEGKKHA